VATRYTVTIHCDERRGHACHGLLQLSGAGLRDVDEARALAATGSKGWLRGYRVEQTYDVCPACRPLVELAVAGLAETDVQEGG
jgi:hypothetical protein